MKIAPITFVPPSYHHPAELAMLARLRDRGPELVEEYIAKNSNCGACFIGRDKAKRVFPEYLLEPTLYNRYADAAASALADAARRTILNRPVQSGRDVVVILTGCPASGKTISVGPDFVAEVEIQHETILTAFPKASGLIDQALEANRRPVVRLFYTDDPRINVRRMIDRARRIGRTVPLSYMAETYVGVPAIVNSLRSKYGALLTVQVTNNSETPAQVVHHHRMVRALYHVNRYTEESALEAMHAELDRISDTPDGIPETILAEARRT